MDNLLTAIANFITDHWFCFFLVLFFSPPRLFTINSNKVERKEKIGKKEEKHEM